MLVEDTEKQTEKVLPMEETNQRWENKFPENSQGS